MATAPVNPQTEKETLQTEESRPTLLSLALKNNAVHNGDTSNYMDNIKMAMMKQRTIPNEADAELQFDHQNDSKKHFDDTADSEHNFDTRTDPENRFADNEYDEPPAPEQRSGEEDLIRM